MNHKQCHGLMAMDAAHGIYPPRWPSNNLQTLICRRLCQQPPQKKSVPKYPSYPLQSLPRPHPVGFPRQSALDGVSGRSMDLWRCRGVLRRAARPDSVSRARWWRRWSRPRLCTRSGTESTSPSPARALVRLNHLAKTRHIGARKGMEEQVSSAADSALGGDLF